MTEALYEFAYMKACSSHPHTRITANVQAVYEAHRLYVKRLEKIIQKLVHESSAEGDVHLKIYTKQQNATHMKDTAAVEEFYLSALSQAETSNLFFCQRALLWKAVTVILKLMQIVSWQLQKRVNSKLQVYLLPVSSL